MTDRAPSCTGNHLVVLMPVFNDWESVQALLLLLDDSLGKGGKSADVVLVDDRSTEIRTEGISTGSYEHLNKIEVLRLRRNVGHQRAICIGLSYLASMNSIFTTIVMDSDGEDDPEDIPRLLAHATKVAENTVVFAERKRRSEGAVFRCCYLLYRFCHWLLVGHRVRFGNFSLIPPECLRSLVVVPELWSHYAAAVVSSKLAYSSVPCNRGKRLAGDSQMNVVGLVVHGLSALAVFSDRLGTRVLLGTLLTGLLTLIGICVVVVIRLATDLAIPGWATYTVGVLVIVLGQLVAIASMFCFIVLSQRSQFGFLPIRDYALFVDQSDHIWRRDE